MNRPVRLIETFAMIANSSIQTIGPLCAEVSGLQNLQSLLSLSWMAIILPTTCESEV